MLEEICYWAICFTPISNSSQERIFGFSEYLTAVALLAVLYTITDVRYKFRIAVSPGSLYTTTFIIVTIIGIQSLLTEVWIAEGWWVPVTNWLDYTIWQAIFGLLFLSTFITWMYYAFIKPPIYGKNNALRYARELYKYVLRGSSDELKVIANELVRSAPALIKHTKVLNLRFRDEDAPPVKVKKRAEVEDFAHDILLLIANRKLCRQIVAASPVTAQIFFEEMIATKKFNIPIGQFAQTISSEAIEQSESFLYVETQRYTSELLGYLKPVSQALYGNYNLVEALANNHMSPLDIHYEEQWKWNAKQWEAYCRATLLTFKGYLSNENNSPNSYALIRAFDDIKHALHDLPKLDGLTDTFNSEASLKLRVVTEFITEAVNLISKQSHPPLPLNNVREGTYPKNIYDYIAMLIYEVCLMASYVKSPSNTCWTIHHNLVWSAFFGNEDDKAWNIVRYKVRRLLYDEVVGLAKHPNYKGSSILGFCLNILLDNTKPTSDYLRAEYPLAIAVQTWARKNYLKLRKDNLDVANSALIGSISFDKRGNRLVKTYLKGLNRVAPKSYLKLDPIITKSKIY